MIEFETEKIKSYQYEKTHKGIVIKITIFHPSLLIPWLFEQCKKVLTYRKAITMQQPYWNGRDWQEFSDFDDMPF